MTGLRLFFFAEFAAVALMGPLLTLPFRRVLSKLAVVCVPLALGLVPLLVLVRIFMPSRELIDLVHLQLLAISFGMAVAGSAALAGRRWMWGGPVVVVLLALLVLATPFWGDVLLQLDSDPIRIVSRQWLVAVNPLFNVSAELDAFDWTHGDVLYRTYAGYKLTRIGEDFAYRPAPLWALLISYPSLGLLTCGLAGIVRQKGRPSEYLVQRDSFC